MPKASAPNNMYHTNSLHDPLVTSPVSPAGTGRVQHGQHFQALNSLYHKALTCILVTPKPLTCILVTPESCRHCAEYSLAKSDRLRTFSAGDSKSITLVSIEPKNKKYPIIAITGGQVLRYPMDHCQLQYYNTILPTGLKPASAQLHIVGLHVLRQRSQQQTMP
jgi:hypothetical protein